jgi:hypothetical protein
MRGENDSILRRAVDRAVIDACERDHAATDFVDICIDPGIQRLTVNFDRGGANRDLKKVV